MKTLFISIFIILNCMSVNGQDLDSLRWKHRVLIINADVLAPDEFEKQLEAFRKNKKELKERKLKIYQIKNSKYKKGLDLNVHWENMDASLIDSWKKFNQIGIALVGLDGGVKLQQKNNITLQELFNTIDAMPMRKREM